MHKSFTGPQNLVDDSLFTFLLNREIHKATRLQYCLSVLCMTPDVSLRRADRAFLSRLAKLGVMHLRATDVAARLNPSCVGILLVDAETHNLPTIFHRLQEGVEPLSRLTLSAGGGCYPQTAASGSDLVRQAVDLMVRAKSEGGNRLNLPL